MRECSLTLAEVGMMINMLNELRREGVITDEMWITPEAKSVWFKIQPFAKEQNYYLKVNG